MTGLQVTRTLQVPDAELTWRFSRASGPGGQGVNTTDSRVELAFDVTGSSVLSEQQRERVLQRLARRVVDGRLVVVASEHRSQLRNRDAAARRMAQLLREALAPDPARRRPTRPTLGSQRRRLQTKTQRGETKRLRRPPSE
ncbi:alternative ribosome rescue aminoacyl-tRNA hydrolase ArfB [Angustibacter sp. Root456]|uniref:alternative ribosome rescue aminoacyl-tRNA hydrolase ArfB n=1 Tax=Angustibacter sp. Root456 TaxID=1736539 RepID=UPI0006F82A66|nr:alternative ribosome rescue aminoacyl-tRNA hydrolase ArfB [Angustibacter sp. Root456]KQX68558.1 peptide chain release factor 1 [Angustibacter sp. Root456]